MDKEPSQQGNPWAAPARSAQTVGAEDPAPTATRKLDPAATGGFGIRFLGRLIDIVLVSASGCFAGVIAAVVLAVLTRFGEVEPGWEQRMNEGHWLLRFGGAYLAGVMGNVLYAGMAGTSPGKWILGYRVVGVDTSAPCSLKAALIRELGFVVDSLFFGLPAYVSMSDSPLNQRLGDQWAGTVVVKASALPAMAKRSSGMVLAGLCAGFVAHGCAMAVVSIIAGL